MNRLLQKQIASLASSDAAGNFAKLSDLVGATYDEMERDRRRVDRSISLMVEENEQLFAELEASAEALARKNAHFLAALENLAHGLVICDAEHRVLVANRRFADLYGLPLEAVAPGSPLLDVIAEAIRIGTFTDPGIADMAKGAPARLVVEPSIEDSWRTAQDRIIVFNINKLDDGGWISLHRDVTNARTAQKQLAESEAKLKDFLSTATDWTWETDSEHRVIALSQAYYTNGVFAINAMLGLRREEHPVIEASREALARDYTAAMAERRPIRNFIYGVRGPDGSTHYVRLSGNPIFGKDGEFKGYRGTSTNVTSQVIAEEQLQSLAYYDPLTGLANRALFQRELAERLAALVRCGSKGALLLLDLDRFKEVNDTLGHAAGDELLRKTAGILSATLGGEAFLARLGGDEFAVVMRDCEARDAEETSRRIIKAFAEPVSLERGEVFVSTSIGVVLTPEHGADPDTLMRHADLALYRAKEEGRGRLCVFESDMDVVAQAKIALARDLRQALGGIGGLEAHFQPQVDLVRGKVIGFETLMRWRHPVHGYVPPAKFIPIAESSSLICDVGLWILRESASVAKRWLDAGESERPISVNVSAAQIWQSDLEADVARVLAETELPPRLLCLELTESLFADHSEGRVRKALEALKRLGVTLALDDFGTGYSSLGYLTQLPFDKLKIDRVFIHGVATSSRRLQLLEGMVALGRGLGMTVVAEGAETEADLAAVAATGCRQVQGYVFSRAEPAEAALTFARQFDIENEAETGLSRLKALIPPRDVKADQYTVPATSVG
jgi:diguanylate cyclase (GGDEF)-like protein/PAS domain S-box-containing protein